MKIMKYQRLSDFKQENISMAKAFVKSGVLNAVSNEMIDEFFLEISHQSFSVEDEFEINFKLKISGKDMLDALECLDAIDYLESTDVREEQKENSGGVLQQPEP